MGVDVERIVCPLDQRQVNFRGRAQSTLALTLGTWHATCTPAHLEPDALTRLHEQWSGLQRSTAELGTANACSGAAAARAFVACRRG